MGSIQAIVRSSLIARGNPFTRVDCAISEAPSVARRTNEGVQSEVQSGAPLGVSGDPCSR